MSSSDGRLTLVFNGEIYNFIELRAELSALGHTFGTTSDTEVIIHAYEQWGAKCLARFNGMWAFALWDSQNQSLFCARDRFGVKPFLYAATRKGFIFASEAKALLALDPSLAEPAYDQLYRFLRTGLLAEGAATFFEGVRQLPAGHQLTVNAGGDVSVTRYYSLAERVLMPPTESDPTAFGDLFEDAVRLRLRSDVPLGTCLSGGLDSSSIVAVMASLTDTDVHTFTSVYPGTDSDEGEYAHAVAKRYGTHEHWIEPKMGDFAEVLPQLTWHQDAPTAAPGLYSQWHVMKLASEHVKVLLDGQGADEVLGGYSGFYSDYVAALLLDGRLGKLGAEWSELREQLHQNPLVPALRSLLPLSLRKLGRRIQRSNTMMSADFRREWRASEPPPVKPSALQDPFGSSLYEAITRVSLPALLQYEDRNSMAFSVEARTPFLDYRLVEHALALPYDQKLRGWQTKLPLRKAMSSLPAEVLQRRDKKGFPTPLALWLRTGLMPLVRQVLLSPEARSREITDATAVAKLLDEHLEGRADHHWEIWRLLTLELWFRSFIDQQGPVTL